MAAPPPSPSYWDGKATGFFMLGILGVIIIASLIGYFYIIEVAVLLIMAGVFLSLVFGALMRRKPFQIEQEEYNKQFSWWEKTWVCLRCGAKYRV
jgi:hypothetical protein